MSKASVFNVSIWIGQDDLRIGIFGLSIIALASWVIIIKISIRIVLTRLWFVNHISIWKFLKWKWNLHSWKFISDVDWINSSWQSRFPKCIFLHCQYLEKLSYVCWLSELIIFKLAQLSHQCSIWSFEPWTHIKMRREVARVIEVLDQISNYYD